MSGKQRSGIPARIRALRAEGLSNGEIRERLGVSVSAVTEALRGINGGKPRGSIR